MKKKIITLILIILIIFFIGTILFLNKNYLTSPIKNLNQTAKTVENTSRKTIDVTYLEDNGNLEHEHIIKTMYDENKHWEECTICGQRTNENGHTYATSWSAGTPNDCSPQNILKKVCTCGYNLESTEGRKAHTMVYTNNDGTFQRILACSSCRNSNELVHDCYKANGTRINCLNLGTCNICNYTYTTSKAQHYACYSEELDSNLQCMICNTVAARVSKYELVKESENVYKFSVSIIVPENAQYISNSPAQFFGNNVSIQNSFSRNGTTWNNVATIKFNGHNEIKSYACIFNSFRLNGRVYVINLLTKDFYIDEQEPVISNINMENSEELTEWSKTKPIIISGTENYCNTVKVKIINENGETIFDGGGNVTSNNYQIQCIPEVECDTNGKTFTAIVTDNCGNSTEKEFTISKVDSIPPTPTSGTEILGDWAKSKDFTFTSIDYGIGQVSIAFNDKEDLKLANIDDNTYSRDYTFTGDVYIPKQLSVMYKDGLGNTSMQKITIDKLDNTAPTITKAELHNNKLTINANDEHKTLGEGSGVVKYRYIASENKITNPKLTTENTTESTNAEITIEDIYKMKYIYVVAEDYVGNISEIYEFEVPQLILTSTVNLSTVDGKGEIILDWSTYDVSDKYFVIYRKQDNQTEWETIVPLTQKLTGNKYIDKLGNDKAKPDSPNIKITGDTANNNINITAESTDNGTKYTYYIESYDINTSLLLSISKQTSKNT